MSFFIYFSILLSCFIYYSILLAIFKKMSNYFKTTNGLHVRMYFKKVYISHSVGSSIYLLFIHGIHINILNTNLQLFLKYHRSVIKL